MKDKNFEHLWNAYLDGELSASEASEFESSLSDEDRERLSSEMQFENALADRLRLDSGCPDDVWARAQAQITAQSNITPLESHRGRRQLLMAASSIAAATLVVFALTSFRQSPPPAHDNSAVVMTFADVTELAESSAVAPGRNAAEQYLRERGIALKLNAEQSIPFAQHHYGIRIVGAREEKIGGVTVQEILMGCCGQPVKLLAAPRGSATATALLAAADGDGNDIVATRNVGEYLTVAVSNHHAHGLLDIFGE